MWPLLGRELPLSLENFKFNPLSIYVLPPSCQSPCRMNTSTSISILVVTPSKQQVFYAHCLI